MSRRSVILLAASSALWLGCVATGLCALQHYSAVAGAAAPTRNATKFFSAHRQPDRPLLVMAVHPKCPCTRASLAELGDLLARSRGSCDALLLQYHPEASSPGWNEDVMPRQLGGVTVRTLLDRGGRIGSALGAVTSGHVVLVDARGIERFGGGITLSRGHRGRAPAQDTILQILAGENVAAVTSPVFGCALSPECSAPITP